MNQMYLTPREALGGYIFAEGGSPDCLYDEERRKVLLVDSSGLAKAVRENINFGRKSLLHLRKLSPRDVLEVRKKLKDTRVIIMAE